MVMCFRQQKQRLSIIVNWTKNGWDIGGLIKKYKYSVRLAADRLKTDKISTVTYYLLSLRVTAWIQCVSNLHCAFRRPSEYRPTIRLIHPSMRGEGNSRSNRTTKRWSRQICWTWHERGRKGEIWFAYDDGKQDRHISTPRLVTSPSMRRFLGMRTNSSILGLV